MSQPFTPLPRSRWRHLDVAAAWLVALSLMVTSSIIDSDHMGRWALLLGMMAMALMCTRMVLAAVLKAFALFEGYVQVEDGKACVTRIQDFTQRPRGKRERRA